LPPTVLLSITLAGFKSRCATPLEWATANASTTCLSTLLTHSSLAHAGLLIFSCSRRPQREGGGGKAAQEEAGGEGVSDRPKKVQRVQWGQAGRDWVPSAVSLPRWRESRA
jgi:hypothetical protein